MKIKKADIILAVIIAIVGIAASIYLTLYTPDIENGKVVIYQNKEVYGEYPLDENQVIEVQNGSHINKITINDGNVQMTFSDCKNQECIKQGIITDGSKSIICLPNKVVVEIQSEESKYDYVSQ